MGVTLLSSSTGVLLFCECEIVFTEDPDLATRSSTATNGIDTSNAYSGEALDSGMPRGWALVAGRCLRDMDGRSIWSAHHKRNLLMRCNAERLVSGALPFLRYYVKTMRIYPA